MSAFTFSTLCVLFIATSGNVSSTQGIPRITVDYTIANDLQGEPFKHSIRVSVPEGSLLLNVMQKAQEMNPEHFSFLTEPRSWGPFVTSINGLAGSSDAKTYWQFFNDKAHLEEGVGKYIPKDGEHIFVIFSTY